MTLVDTNILIDVLLRDPRWYAWSSQQLAARSIAGKLIIVDVIFAELSLSFETAAQVETAIEALGVSHVPMSPAALHRAAVTFRTYRRSGGAKTNVLPDFFVGAQAATEKIPLLTRDTRRYRTYFPDIELILPEA